MARIKRTEFPLPTLKQFVAIDALMAAYLALNATDMHAMAMENGPNAPMVLVRKAGTAALALLPGVTGPAARAIWHEMVDNGDNALWNYNLWRNDAL